MASISTDSSGNRRIQFVEYENDIEVRKSLYVGRVTMEAAQGVRRRVEIISQAKRMHQPVPEKTQRWLATIDARLYGKLARVGLVEPRVGSGDASGAARLTVAAFVDSYIAGRTDVKPATRDLMKQARRFLVEHFGEACLLKSVTPGDADEFRRFVMTKLGENTARRMCGRAKQFFRAAARKKLIRVSPFADMGGNGVRERRDRQAFVSREDAKMVLDACPDAQWRLLFALCRFGGLRCPSEPLSLRWSDVDWEKGRMTVTSPKTAHHEGKGTRVVPIFPELRPYLEDAYALAPEGAEFVITRYRDRNANLRTQLERIIRKAGVKPWPKPFQNLRSTRETELAEEYPIHVVCQWIGNSEAVAKRHYLQVTEEHFKRAMGKPESVSEGASEKTTQNPTQQILEMGCNGEQVETEKVEISRENTHSPRSDELSSCPARIRT